MGNMKWVASMGNFVFALFHSGYGTAVGYNSASGKWGVKEVKFRVGGSVRIKFRVKGSVGNRFRVGLSVRNRFREKYCRFLTTSGQLSTPHCSGRS